MTYKLKTDAPVNTKNGFLLTLWEQSWSETPGASALWLSKLDLFFGDENVDELTERVKFETPLLVLTSLLGAHNRQQKLRIDSRSSQAAKNECKSCHWPQ